MVLCCTRSRLLVLLGALVVILLLSVSPVHGDTVAGTNASQTDRREFFRRTGNLTTTDVAANNGLDGPPYKLVFESPKPIPPLWEIWIKHKTSWNAAGAVNVEFCIHRSNKHPSRHIHGPHKPPPANKPLIDDDPSAILPACSGKIPRIRFGRKGGGHFFHRVQHPTRVGGRHYDHIKFKAIIKAENPAGGNRLTGTYDVQAKHTKSKGRPAFLALHVFGSSSDAGTLVDYDAGSGRLAFDVGAIDVLQEDGHTSGIAPGFAGDPMLSGQLTVTDLQLLGQDPDGSFRFTGGQVAVVDPVEQFDIQGVFEDYVVDTTLAAGNLVSSFALFDSLSGIDVEDAEDGPSAYLDAFFDQNTGGVGVPEEDWLRMDGVQLAILTETDLVAATDGFTRSARIPATLLLAAADIPPDLPPPGVPDGRDGSPLIVDRLSTDGTDLALSWDGSSCDDPGDYHLLFGAGAQLPQTPGGEYGVAGAVCDIGLTPSFAWVGSPHPGLFGPGGLLWFLMVADDNVAIEGSWGTDSRSNERDGGGPGGASGQCRMADKDTSNACNGPCPPFDFWTTVPDQPSAIQFGNDVPPLPPNFFFPGSQPFVGVIPVRGVADGHLNAAEPGIVDTIVARMEPIDLTDDPIGTFSGFSCEGESFFPGVDSSGGRGGGSEACIPGSLPPLVPLGSSATAVFWCPPPPPPPEACSYALIDVAPSFVDCNARDDLRVNLPCAGETCGSCPPLLVVEFDAEPGRCVGFYECEGCGTSVP